MIRALGIDPGLTTGIAVVDFFHTGKENLVFFKDIHAKGETLLERIYNLSQTVKSIFWEWEPRLIGYETHYHEKSHGIWTRDDKNTGNMFMNQQACGAILAVIGEYLETRDTADPTLWGCKKAYPVCTSNPRTLKRVVLKKRAQEAARLRWNQKLGQNAADASQFALYAYQEYLLEQRRIE